MQDNKYNIFLKKNLNTKFHTSAHGTLLRFAPAFRALGACEHRETGSLFPPLTPPHTHTLLNRDTFKIMAFYGRKAINNFPNTSQKIHYFPNFREKNNGNNGKISKQFE